MQRELHFERMKETSNIVIPFIKGAYSDIKRENGDLFEALNFFIKRRTKKGQCLLRPYLVRLGYELTGRNNWIDIAPACAAIELFNISTYQSNIAFDGKKGIYSSYQKSNQFISSMISLELAIKTLHKLKTNFPDKTTSTIIERLLETNNDIYIGQFYDLNELTVKSLNLSMSEREYLSLYLKRCKKLGGSLTSLCLEIGFFLGEGDILLIDPLKRIGMILGTAGQIVNDISDFLPLENEEYEEYKIKGYESQFSDFRKGKITYPLFHLLNVVSKERREIIIAALMRKQIDVTMMEEIRRCLNRYGSITSAKRIVLSYYKEIKKEIKIFPKTRSRDFLSVAFSSLITNKYFAMLNR